MKRATKQIGRDGACPVSLEGSEAPSETRHAASLPIEPERYEFSERRPYCFEVDRREFFKLLGAGMIVCATASAAQQREGARRGGQAAPAKIESWIHIGESGAVTVYTGKAEMGQNIRTSLAQQVADELRVALASITLVMADTALTPWDAGTFGSRTTPQMGTRLRTVSAAAREALMAQAAQRWQVPATQLEARDGAVMDAAGHRSLRYSELLRGQQIAKEIGDNGDDGLALMPPAEWRVAGAAAPKVDGRAFVTGAHQYTSDMRRPGMLYGKVVRPAGFNATLASLDTKAAESASITVVHDANFVGIAAASEHAAMSAARAVKAEWSVPPQPGEAELYDALRKNAGRGGATAGGEGGGQGRFVQGNVEQAQAAADKKLARTYTVAYIAHC